MIMMQPLLIYMALTLALAAARVAAEPGKGEPYSVLLRRIWL